MNQLLLRSCRVGGMDPLLLRSWREMEWVNSYGGAGGILDGDWFKFCFDPDLTVLGSVL